VIPLLVRSSCGNALLCSFSAKQKGGPGGSSLIGLLTENGPLTLNDFSFGAAYNASGVPTVFANPHSWHAAPANMIYVEHPAPTGFSYCLAGAGAGADDAAEETPVDCAWDDASQAKASLAFYVAFFDAYPEVGTLAIPALAFGPHHIQTLSGSMVRTDVRARRFIFAL
jgi:hypothetical protein